MLAGTALSALLLLGCGGSSSASSSAPPTFDPSQYLTVEAGTLPVVLSAPHGGTMMIPGIPERTTGTTVLDANTYELATAIQNQLFLRTGKKAYLVAALVSRKQVDFNRAAAEAYETQAIAPLYQAYQVTLQSAVTAVKAQSAASALLVDVHGQGTSVTLVFRGTRDGKTANLATLYATAPDGFVARLLGNGISVVPNTSGGTENPDYNGGFIVATHGRMGTSGINAIQLEFGFDYRGTATQRDDTASKVVDALVAHLQATGTGLQHGFNGGLPPRWAPLPNVGRR